MCDSYVSDKLQFAGQVLFSLMLAVILDDTDLRRKRGYETEGYRLRELENDEDEKLSPRYGCRFGLSFRKKGRFFICASGHVSLR
jgi:hypothetical protein